MIDLDQTKEPQSSVYVLKCVTLAKGLDERSNMSGVERQDGGRLNEDDGDDEKVGEINSVAKDESFFEGTVRASFTQEREEQKKEGKSPRGTTIQYLGKFPG